jgi:hypothetical protein
MKDMNLSLLETYLLADEEEVDLINDQVTIVE